MILSDEQILKIGHIAEECTNVTFDHDTTLNDELFIQKVKDYLRKFEQPTLPKGYKPPPICLSCGSQLLIKKYLDGNDGHYFLLCLSCGRRQ